MSSRRRSENWSTQGDVNQHPNCLPWITSVKNSTAVGVDLTFGVRFRPRPRENKRRGRLGRMVDFPNEQTVFILYVTT